MLGFFFRFCSTLWGWLGGHPAPAGYLSVEQLLRLPVEVQMHIVAYMGTTDMIEMVYADPLFKAFITAVPKYWEAVLSAGEISIDRDCDFVFYKRFPRSDGMAVDLPSDLEPLRQRGVEKLHVSRKNRCIMDSGVWACQVNLNTDLGDPRRDQEVINYTELVDILANNSRVRMLSGAPHSWVNGEPWKPNLQATILTISKVNEIKDGWPYGTDTYGAVAVDVLWGYRWEYAFWEKFANMVNGLPQVKLLRASLPVTVTRLPQLSLLKVPSFKVYYEQPIAFLVNLTPHKDQCPLLAVNSFRQMISEWLRGEREIDRILVLCTRAIRTDRSPFNMKELLVLVAGLAEGLPGCFKICASAWLIRRTETSRDGLVISLQPQIFMLCRCDYWDRRERAFEDSLQHCQAFATLLEAHQRMKSKGLSAQDTRIKKTIFEKDARAYLKAYGALLRRVVLCDFAICASLCFDYNWASSSEKLTA
ncbi:unnamed protein product, partial [Mesorhabditis spiculigera]